MKEKKYRFLEWFIYMLGYAFVFILATHLFKNFYMDLSYFGVYALLLSIIVFILNKTIKPILLFLTMPITGLTLGLFYFVINVLILKIADWILLSHFNIGTNIHAFFIAIAISVLNILVEGLVIKPVIRRLEKNE